MDFEFNIINESVIEGLRSLPDKSVHMVITSTPYYGLRSYNVPPTVWGGRSDCEHEWVRNSRSIKRHGGSSHGATSTLAGSRAIAKAQQKARTLDPGDTCALCGAWRGKLGEEPTPALFVRHMRLIFAEVVRVLRDDGTIWLNLGDSFAGSGGAGGDYNKGGMRDGQAPYRLALSKKEAGLKNKDLIGIPWRTALALQGFSIIPARSLAEWSGALSSAIESEDWNAVRDIEKKIRANAFFDTIQEKGLYLRSEIIWAKGISGHAVKFGWSGGIMPESPLDRCTRSHEQVFVLSKKPRYFFDVHAISEPSTPDKHKKQKKGYFRSKYADVDSARPGDEAFRFISERRRRRTVWTIPVEPFSGAHYAVMPTALAKTSILAGTPAGGVCAACGKPYERVTFEREPDEEALKEHLLSMGANQDGSYNGQAVKDYESHMQQNASEVKRNVLKSAVKAASTGFEWAPACGCGAGARPAVVLDPFSGAGTSGVAAKLTGRNYIGIELDPASVAISETRIRMASLKPPKGRKRKAIPEDGQYDLSFSAQYSRRPN